MYRMLTRVFSVLVVFGMVLVPAIVVAQTATVLDFEDLAGGGQAVPLADGYGGIASWGAGNGTADSWVVIGDVPTENYPPHSGTQSIYTLYPTTPIEFGTEYVFEGAYLGGVTGDGYDAPVHYELYLGGVLVHTSEGYVMDSVSVWCPSGYDGLVDTMYIKQTGAPYGLQYFTVDDFTYVDPTVAVESMTLSGIKELFR